MRSTFLPFRVEQNYKGALGKLYNEITKNTSHTIWYTNYTKMAKDEINKLHL